MTNHLEEIHWIEKNDVVDYLLLAGTSLKRFPMESGLEAEVIKICSDDACFVLKVWNKSSRPNVKSQFDLLRSLNDLDVSVSTPLGWGLNSDSEMVMLTRFNGTPIVKVNQQKLTEIAAILSKIHEISIEGMEITFIPKYDFISYFYPGIQSFPDLHNKLIKLVESSNFEHKCIIHGDYNMGNILESDGLYTIIDWTNGQLGDPRYDVAWANILIKIYIGDKYSSMFLSAYLSENQYIIEEIEMFEAMACLRWILLNKLFDLPKRPDTIARVKKINKTNTYLNLNKVL